MDELFFTKSHCGKPIYIFGVEHLANVMKMLKKGTGIFH